MSYIFAVYRLPAAGMRKQPQACFSILHNLGGLLRHRPCSRPCSRAVNLRLSYSFRPGAETKPPSNVPGETRAAQPGQPTGGALGRLSRIAHQAMIMTSPAVLFHIILIVPYAVMFMLAVLLMPARCR